MKHPNHSLLTHLPIINRQKYNVKQAQTETERTNRINYTLVPSKPYILANPQMFSCVCLATTSPFFMDGEVVTNPYAL